MAPSHSRPRSSNDRRPAIEAQLDDLLVFTFLERQSELPHHRGSRSVIFLRIRGAAKIVGTIEMRFVVAVDKWEIVMRERAVNEAVSENEEFPASEKERRHLARIQILTG